jgi:hypothetical protein
VGERADRKWESVLRASVRACRGQVGERADRKWESVLRASVRACRLQAGERAVEIVLDG